MKTYATVMLHSMVLPVCLMFTAQASPASSNTDWPLYGRTLDNQRYSPLHSINTANVANLRLAWRFRTGKTGSFQTSPIIEDGIMYITTPYNHVIALDAASGTVHWRYTHTLDSTDFCCGPANRGVAISRDHVLTVTIDARLVALDKATGNPVWDIKLVDTQAGAAEDLRSLPGVKELAGAVQSGQSGYTANLAPQVYGDTVYSGITGAGYGLHMEINQDGEQVLSVGGLSGDGHGLRGFLLATDIHSGRELWRWYSVADGDWTGSWAARTAWGAALNRDLQAERAAAARYRDSWRAGGGSIWTTPAIDPELGLIFIGTGNPSPQMDDTTRPGDNLYTVSLVALELDTGKLRWHYQQVPHDRWGYDVASPPVLFDIEHNGRTVKAIGQASKLGWFFIHDRQTGELIRRSEPFVPQENLFARPSATGVRIVPGTLGACSWSPVAYHPGSKRVFIAGIYQPSMFYARTLTATADRPWQSYTFFKPADEPDYGLLSAVNVHSGKVDWQVKTGDPLVGGVLVTGGNLVFTGHGDGRFVAYSATDGTQLWQYRSEFGVNAPPVTYTVGAVQYVAVAAGGNKLYGYKTGDEVLVFRLKN